MKTIKRSISILIVAVLAVMVMVSGLSVSAAKDTYGKYVEFKGSVGIISNCEGTGSTQGADQTGIVDPLGVALPAEFNNIKGEATPAQRETVEGTATKSGMASEQVNYTTEHYLQGKSGVSIHVTPDQNFEDGQATKLYNTKTRFVIRQMKDIKVTDPQNTYLCFYMYLPGDASNWSSQVINWNSSGIEISEISDVNEMYFSMASINQNNINGGFVSGWNQIILPLNKLGNNAKKMPIKMFRFFLYGVKGASKSVTVTFDNFSLETGASLKALGINVPSVPTTSSKPTATSSATKPTSSTAPVTSSDVSSATDVTSKEPTTTISSEPSVDLSFEPDTDAAADADTDEDDQEPGSMLWLWIVIGAVVGGGAAVIAVLVSKKKA